MRHTWAGQLEHLAYLVIGCQFFVVVIGDPPIRWKLAAPARLFMLALSMAVDTFTGVALLQTTVPVSMSPPPSLHVNTLTDTQTGGAMRASASASLAIGDASIDLRGRKSASSAPSRWSSRASSAVLPMSPVIMPTH